MIANHDLLGSHCRGLMPESAGSSRGDSIKQFAVFAA